MQKIKLEQIPEAPMVALGVFRKEAKRQGWTADDVRDFMNAALSADHQHLKKFIEEHIEREDEQRST